MMNDPKLICPDCRVELTLVKRTCGDDTLECTKCNTVLARIEPPRQPVRQSIEGTFVEMDHSGDAVPYYTRK